jgi:hypothetical protein
MCLLVRRLVRLLIATHTLVVIRWDLVLELGFPESFELPNHRCGSPPGPAMGVANCTPDDGIVRESVPASADGGTCEEVRPG